MQTTAMVLKSIEYLLFGILLKSAEFFQLNPHHIHA